ncbi:hypothetical protein [Bacillus subtilis]
MYAMRPEENYCDRSKGPRFGWFHITDSAHKEYLVPQQSGNLLSLLLFYNFETMKQICIEKTLC